MGFWSSKKSHTVFFIIILIITVIIIWKCYWRIQLMYNSGILSLYTPDTFYINPQNKEKHDQMTSIGFNISKNKTVVICALLRDAYDRLPVIMKRAEKLGEMFKDYRILIVENDSVDMTRESLLRWKDKNPKVVILGCGVNTKEMCKLSGASKKTVGHEIDRQRIEKMTHLRNIYLDYIKTNMKNFDYAVVWDMDIIGTVYLDGVANTIGHMNNKNSETEKADAMCAYGIYRWGWMTLYYDTYAHIDIQDQFHIDLKIIHDVKKGIGVNYERGSPPVKVISCFSGFTVYKISSINENVKYDMSPPDNLECEHVRLHRNFDNVYMNPSMIHFVLRNE